MKSQINKLTLSWSISKGRDTYGYNCAHCGGLIDSAYEVSE